MRDEQATAECPQCGEELPPDTQLCPSCSGSDSLATRDYSDPDATGDFEGPSPPRSLSLEPGQLLDARYEVLGLLGRGGMGEVYRVRDRVLERVAAIKFLRPSEQSSEGERLERQRLLTEARTTAGLNHPNIVTVYDAVERESDSYIVMELVEGQTLATQIRHDGACPWRAGVALLAQVAQGLAYAHERGIIHRDIKPANIMVTRHGHAKIMDLGLAQPTQLPAGADRRRILGTPQFMSPEQIRRETLDTRTDLFSLGVVAYMLLTGVHPFGAPELSETVIRILGSREADASSRVESIPTPLSSLICKLMEKDRARRVQSAAQLADSLRSLLEPERRKLEWQRPVLVGLVLVALAGALGTMQRQSRLEAAAGRELAVGGKFERALQAGAILLPARQSAVYHYGDIEYEYPGSATHSAAQAALRVRLVRLADEALTVGNLPQARSLLWHLERADPEDEDVQYLSEKAERLEERARLEHSKTLGLGDLRQAAEQALAQGRLEGAGSLRELLNIIRSIAPDDPAVSMLHRQAAERLERHGDLKGLEGEPRLAADAYQSALKWAPSDSLLERKLAAAAQAVERADAAAAAGASAPPAARPAARPRPTRTPIPSSVQPAATPLALRRAPDRPQPNLGPDPTTWPRTLSLSYTSTRMVLVPVGDFEMGSNSSFKFERPVNSVWVDAFYMDEFELTNADYELYDPTHKRSYVSSCDRCPVVEISWHEATEYARWSGKRLPTEAEWEKAARGGLRDARYPWGDENPDGRANFHLNAAWEVGDFAPNGFGLYDMAGNVSEWCADWFDPETYSRRKAATGLALPNNPQGPPTGKRRVVRGGSFLLNGKARPRDAYDGLRVSTRYSEDPGLRNYAIGVRLVWSPGQPSD